MKINGQTVEARKESLRKYRQTEKCKECQRRYFTTEKGKASNKRRRDKYRTTIKGKEANKKAKYKRERNLGFIRLFPNPFGETIKIHWHHITDNYIITLPAIEHTGIGGGGKNHREKCWFLVEKYYTDDGNTIKLGT